MFCVFGCYKFSEFWQAIAAVYSRVDRTFSIQNREIHATNQPTSQPATSQSLYFGIFATFHFDFFSLTANSNSLLFCCLCMLQYSHAYNVANLFPCFNLRMICLCMYARSDCGFYQNLECFIFCGFFSAWWQIIVAKI